MLPNSITIFTDGSSRGNPGPGGWGAVFVHKDGELKVQELGGREENTTNNRMELTATIEALSFLLNVTGQRSIVIHSDSRYVINGITKWIFGWQKNSWKTTQKKEVENRDLWEKLFELTKGKSIEWRYVGGHAGVLGNERCDEIATTFADGGKVELYSGNLQNYGIENILNVSMDSFAAGEKESARARSRARAYSYVSLVDGIIQTHKTWAECEARVKGKRAKYKKALSAEEEKEIINEYQR